MRANGARAATRHRVGALIAATASLAVLVIAAWAMAGPAPRVAKPETAAATEGAAASTAVVGRSEDERVDQRAGRALYRGDQVR